MEKQGEEKKYSNPTLKTSVFEKAGRAVDASNAMTINGAIGKTGILLFLLALAGAFTWNLYGTFYEGYIVPLMATGFLGAFFLVLVVSFKSKTAPYLAPVYAILQGLALGGVSIMIDSMFPGIALQAISLTVLVASLMLILYRFRVIKVTEKFRSVMTLSLVAIFMFYLITIGLSFFGIHTPLSLGSTMPLWITLGINILMVVFAAFKLLLDFDFIERGAEYQAPKYMEWYGAFGLVVTLAWLYYEILKLLARIANR